MSIFAICGRQICDALNETDIAAGEKDGLRPEYGVFRSEIVNPARVLTLYSLGNQARGADQCVKRQPDLTSKVHRVLIVDEHTIMRDGLCALISADSDFEVVGNVPDSKEAMLAAAAFKPDIVLMGLTMPHAGGIDAIAHIKKQRPSTKVVALTFHMEDKYIRAALGAGADAYVLKNDSQAELFIALNSVLQGKIYLSPAICDRIVPGYLASSDSSSEKPSWELLTRREREVIKLIAEGNRTKEIADYLSVSPKTVDKHRTNLMKKLDLHNVSAVTVFAIQNGLVTR